MLFAPLSCLGDSQLATGTHARGASTKRAAALVRIAAGSRGHHRQMHEQRRNQRLKELAYFGPYSTPRRKIRRGKPRQ